MSLLILREEFVCLVVLAFLLAYTAKYRIKTDNNIFTWILIYGLCHVIFDIITVLTVNRINEVPAGVNYVCHILYYAFSIAFTVAYFQYIVTLTAPIKIQIFFRLGKYIPAALFAISAFFLPIYYVEGNGTNYSYGPLVFMGYGMFVVYCIFAVILIFTNHKKLEANKKITLYPMTIAMIAVIVVQALIPELLMTSAAITFVCLGLFVSFNNPAKEYQEQAYWDAATGIKNKNGYKKQLEIMDKK